MLKTLEQNRANYAWNCIMDIKGCRNKAIEKKYRSFVNKSSALVLTNGLGNMLAFYRSKHGDGSADSKAYEFLYKHLDEWLKNQHITDQDALQWIISANTSSLSVIKATKETLMLTNWLKRFAAAELSGDENEASAKHA